MPIELHTFRHFCITLKAETFNSVVAHPGVICRRRDTTDLVRIMLGVYAKRNYTVHYAYSVHICISKAYSENCW